MSPEQHKPFHPFGMNLKWLIERDEGFDSGAGVRGIAF